MITLKWFLKKLKNIIQQTLRDGQVKETLCALKLIAMTCGFNKTNDKTNDQIIDFDNMPEETLTGLIAQLKTTRM